LDLSPFAKHTGRRSSTRSATSSQKHHAIDMQMPLGCQTSLQASAKISAVLRPRCVQSVLMAGRVTDDRSCNRATLAIPSERLIACYWMLAFTLAAMGLTFLFCSLQTTSSDTYIGLLLGPLMLLSAAAVYFRKLHRR
jgi:hypothetical protein